MNIKNFIKIICLFAIVILLNGCQNFNKKYNKPFKHNTPLIKDQKIKDQGKSEIAKTLELGPKPVEGDTRKLGKRKKISSEAQRNYLIISDDYPLLKQRVTLKFQNLDFKETMNLMGKIAEINVLVGDEVAGAISAELIDVPWDKAFQALLDMKNYASDVDVASNLIRIHSPETLTQQENYKSERAQAVKKKVELEDSVEPIYSEIFRLYYISPAQAKTTINELFTQQGGGENSYSPIQITEEKTTRSIIVRGKEKDLDVVDKVIKEIDVRTKQVLIEAFIVEANSDFERALGTRLGGYYLRRGKNMGGVAGASSGSADGTDLNEVAPLGSVSDSITNFAQMGYNKDWTPYVSEKARLDWASLQLSNQFKPGMCRVTMIKPGFVDTDSTAWLKGISNIEDIMMTADSVAEMIEWVIELEDNTQMRTLSFDVGNFNG